MTRLIKRTDLPPRPPRPVRTSPTSPREPESRIFQPPGWVWASSGQVGWWVRPSWRSTLLGPGGLRLDEWRDAGRLTTVKTGPHRVVYRAELDGGAIYIKHYLVPNLRAIMRQWFRRGKGRNEGKRAERLAGIGIPTITPIALGEQRHRKFLYENFLITPEISDSVPLDAFIEHHLREIPELVQPRIRRELARALGVLTARLHEAGFLHTDFHPGNLLVQYDPEESIRLAMIDLDALRVRKRLDWSDVRSNLALLNHYFWMRSARTDRHRFLQAYLQARTIAPPSIKVLARGIETATRRWAERLWRRWSKRCRGSNKYFEIYHGPHSWAVASRELDAETVHLLMENPDAPFSRADARILKESRTTTVAEWTLPVGGKPTQVIYKRFNRKKWLDPLLTMFRPSRAWRAWQAGGHLTSRGVPSPKNLAILARTPFLSRWRPLSRLPHQTYHITEKAEPAMTLSDYLRKVLPTLEGPQRRIQVRKLTIALARLLRMLHERSLTHRDLKVANILIVGDPHADEISLSLIDLVGVRLIDPIPLRHRIQNLARLQVSLGEAGGWTRTDALRFLRAYLPRSLTDRDHWKGLWRAIEASSHKKEQKNRRRGRALS